MSELVPEEQNLAQHAMLEKDLDGYAVYSCVTLDPLGEWMDEPGFLVLGIPFETAHALGSKYRQLAILFGDSPNSGGELHRCD